MPPSWKTIPPPSAGSGAKPGPMGAAVLAPNPFAAADGSYDTILADGQHNAFPGQVRFPDGSSRIVYRRGSNHSPSKGDIYTKTRPDDATPWSAGTLLYSHATLDCRDPQLAVLSDGTVALCYFLSSPTAPGDPVLDGIRVAFSTDKGATFGAPVAVAHNFTAWAAVSAPVVEYQGALIIALQGRNTGDSFGSVALVRSTDRASWTSSAVLVNGQTAAKNYGEPNVEVAADGKLVLSVRNQTDKVIDIRRSTTDWQTYGAVNASFAGDGAPRMERFASGTIFLVTRDAVTGLAIFYYTADNGATWSTWRELDSGISVSYLQMTYASLVEVAPGVGYVVYSQENVAATVSDVFGRYLFERPGVAPNGLMATPKGIVGRRQCCHVTHSANQVLTTAVTATLAFDTERYDKGAFHNKVTNNSRLVAPVDGVYRIRGCVEFAPGAGTYRQLTIRRGGTANIAVKNQSPVSGLSTRMDIEAEYDMAAGDYVELQAAQDSGGNLNVNSVASYSPEFMMSLVTPR